MGTLQIESGYNILKGQHDVIVIALLGNIKWNTGRILEWGACEINIVANFSSFGFVYGLGVKVQIYVCIKKNSKYLYISVKSNYWFEEHPLK